MQHPNQEQRKVKKSTPKTKQKKTVLPQPKKKLVWKEKNSTPQTSNKLEKRRKKCQHKPQIEEEKIRTKESRKHEKKKKNEK